MKLYIFAIGGTGERVLRSFTMLLASGIRAFDAYDIFPIIIDYDAKSGDKERVLKSLKNYTLLHNAAFSRTGRKHSQFFGPEIKQVNGLDNYVLPYAPKDGEKKFREHIGYGDLNGKTVNTQYLLESMYDISTNPTTELNLNMTVGFKGNPNIGSVVFHKLGETTVFRSFIDNYDPTAGDRVVIVGSLFGGTGASGIPEIVQAIKKAKANAKIATLLIQPYFAPERADNAAVKANMFYAKTKAALDYYRESELNNSINAIYHIGDPYPTVVPYCEGGEHQHNNANLVEVLAGMAIEHFVRMNVDAPLTDKEFAFSLQKDIVLKTDNQGKIDTKQVCRIFISDFDDDSKTRIFEPLTKLALATKYVHDEVITGKADTTFYQMLKLNEILDKKSTSEHFSNRLQDTCAHFNSFHSLFTQWLAELDCSGDETKNIKPNSHRLALYQMGKSYDDLILRESVKVDENKDSSFAENAKQFVKKQFQGNRKSNLDDDYLNARMNDHLNKNHCTADGSNLKSDVVSEFAFMDILYRSCNDSYDKLINN